MTTEIVSDQDFNDPGNLIPYLELDDAIVRGVTKGLLDFSNPECFAGGAIAAGTTMKSLTVDHSVGTVTGAGVPVPTIVNGMWQQPSTAAYALRLPDSFKLSATSRKFLGIIQARMPATGYQTATAQTLYNLFGWMANINSDCQWGAALQTIQATGVVDRLYFMHPISGSIAASVTLSNADTLALCDGNLHQIAVYWDGSVAGAMTRRIYVDRVLKYEITSAFDNSDLRQVTGRDPLLGYIAGFQSAYPANFRLARPSLWDLTGKDLDVGALLTADFNAGAGYVS